MGCKIHVSKWSIKVRERDCGRWPSLFFSFHSSIMGERLAVFHDSSLSLLSITFEYYLDRDAVHSLCFERAAFLDFIMHAHYNISEYYKNPITSWKKSADQLDILFAITRENRIKDICIYIPKRILDSFLRNEGSKRRVLHRRYYRPISASII